MNKPDENLKDGKGYSIILVLVLPLVTALVYSGMWVVSNIDSKIGAAFLGTSIGMATGSVGLPAAHELIHRTNKIFQNMGLTILLFCFYGHFRIEHINGHHSKVATKPDPATARPGENAYYFLIRCVIISWSSAWKIEKKLLTTKGEPSISYKNRILLYLFFQFVLLISTWIIFGTNGVIFLAAHTAVAILLLEIVEYIQHYGLQRQRLNHGDIEPIREMHAWNCHHLATNRSTFNLGLHSAHHRQPGKPFPLLSNQKQSMEMPASYPIMILLALIPPIWFKVMNPKLKIIE